MIQGEFTGMLPLLMDGDLCPRPGDKEQQHKADAHMDRGQKE